MASEEKNICNILRESWRSLIALVDYLSTFLRKILNQIQSLINRIKNTIIRRILNTIADIKQIISNFLALQTLDNNLARQDFCRILYQCEIFIKQISKYVSPELFDKIFGPDSIKTIDLSKYGIAPLEFNSKFELFEYVACRLSLRGLLDSITQSLIDQMLEFISKFDKYLDINWWLQNTVWGRVLNRMILEYEAFFNDRIKPFLDQLIPYLDCAFALCDFKVSTNNYFDDFSTKFKAERSQTTNLKYEWKIAKEELYSDLADSLNSTKAEMDVFKVTLQAPITNAKPLFHYRENGESMTPEKLQTKTGNDNQTTPFTSDEVTKIKNNVQNRKSVLVPGLNSGEPIRPVIYLSSPTTED